MDSEDLSSEEVEILEELAVMKRMIESPLGRAIFINLNDPLYTKNTYRVWKDSSEPKKVVTIRNVRNNRALRYTLNSKEDKDGIVNMVNELIDVGLIKERQNESEYPDII